MWQSKNQNLYPQSMSNINFVERTESTSRLLLGTQWSPNTDWNIVLEYLYLTDGFFQSDWEAYLHTLSVLNEASLDTPLKSIVEANSQLIAKRRNYIFSRIFRKKIIQDSDIEWVSFLGLDDGSSMHQLSLYYRFWDSYEYYLRYFFTLGTPRSEFYEFSMQDTWFLGIKCPIPIEL